MATIFYQNLTNPIVPLIIHFVEKWMLSGYFSITDGFDGLKLSFPYLAKLLESVLYPYLCCCHPWDRILQYVPTACIESTYSSYTCLVQCLWIMEPNFTSLCVLSSLCKKSRCCLLSKCFPGLLQAGNDKAIGVQNLETNGDNQGSLYQCEVSPILKSPTPSVSPLPINSSRKSLKASLMLTASQKELTQTIGSEASKNINFKPRSAHLATSLQGGLEVIKKNQKGFAFVRSSLRFSYEPSENKPLFVKKDVDEIEEQKHVMFLCRNYKCNSSQDGNDGQNLRLVPVDDKPDQIARLESLMDGILSAEEFKDEELASLKNENMRKCSKEQKDAIEMAMEGHARLLEQYADLEEKHINLLTSQRRTEDGILDVKKAAAKAGVKSAESKFINALAAEISTLKEEREK
nr:kinesin-like protein KIN-12B [Tanacetum cinerariifolium]